MPFVNGYMATGMVVKCTNNAHYVTFSGWNGVGARHQLRFGGAGTVSTLLLRVY